MCCKVWREHRGMMPAAPQMAHMLTHSAPGAFPPEADPATAATAANGSSAGAAGAAGGYDPDPQDGGEGGGEEGRPVLYVSGEESVEQIGGRAERMGIGSSPRIFVYRYPVAWGVGQLVVGLGRLVWLSEEAGQRRICLHSQLARFAWLLCVLLIIRPPRTCQLVLRQGLRGVLVPMPGVRAQGWVCFNVFLCLISSRLSGGKAAHASLPAPC
jgi:hypothetical protein